MPQPDITVYDANGQLILIVECTIKVETSSDWAAKMRRNIMAHGFLPKAPFFLLALPDRFYLWKDVSNKPEVVEPNYKIDPTPFFQPYYKKSGRFTTYASGESFELIVVSWLNELLRYETLQDTIYEEQEWLINSGFFEAIKGGRLALALSV